MSDTKQNQGGNDEDAPRCPPHPGFVFGLCSLCGAKEEAAGVGALAVAVGDETMKEGVDRDGDGDGDGDPASCPPHPGFVRGLCSRCGAEEEKGEAGWGAPGVAVGYEVTNQGGGDDEDAGGSASGGGVTVAYIHGAGPVLPDLEAATSRVSASDRATLMRERKLILIVDLDHTLINSTGLNDLSPGEQAQGLTPDTIGDPLIDLFLLDLGMLLKLRPFARGFLEQASAMFELHVYTLGTRVYAREVVGLLDPAGVYVGGRIVSRDETAKKGTKSLEVIQGADPAVAVILDDTDYVWPGHQENLILVDRYPYFASTCRTFEYHEIPSLAEQGVDELDDDSGSLAVVLGVLRRVHQSFFDGGRSDVREVITEVRRQVLPECTVVFSYLEEYMEDFPEDTLMWTMAERLGAVCKEDVDETVTHVVAEHPVSAKAQWARDNGRFLVNTEWVKAASFLWRRADELEFPV